MIKIQDVSVPTKGTGKYLNVRVLSFDLTPTDGISLYWAIHSEELVPDESEGAEEGATIAKPGNMLLEGNLSMPQDVYDLWGTEDDYVTSWAAEQLNLTEVTE